MYGFRSNFQSRRAGRTFNIIGRLHPSATNANSLFFMAENLEIRVLITVDYGSGGLR